MTDRKSIERIADFSLKDAEERLRFQHDYTQSGLKTLILLNGGAIVGLLTYAGNAAGQIGVASLKAAFVSYIAGLISACLAYLTAYMSQGYFMEHSTLTGISQLGVKVEVSASSELSRKRGTAFVAAGVALCVMSLIGFGAGSGFAVSSIAAQHERPSIHHSSAPRLP